VLAVSRVLHLIKCFPEIHLNDGVEAGRETVMERAKERVQMVLAIHRWRRGGL
jgi:hypothetical protein